MTPRDQRIEDLERRIKAIEEQISKPQMRLPTEEERARLMERFEAPIRNKRR